jgi:hypothetical protein
MGAHLHDYSIIGAHLQDSSIIGVNLQDYSIIGAHLQDYSISGAHLHDCGILTFTFYKSSVFLEDIMVAQILNFSPFMESHCALHVHGVRIPLPPNLFTFLYICNPIFLLCTFKGIYTRYTEEAHARNRRFEVTTVVQATHKARVYVATC